ncbi:MAG: rod shape-determining protein MreC [Gammaproteobacteria bacterium]|nr:rod shape-determining protein MreC [Gammaproteobacteria bacterium]
MVVTLSIILMISDNQRQQSSEIRAFLLTLMSPIEYIASLPSGFIDWADFSMTSRSQLILDNKELRAEQLILKVQSQRMISLESENAHLRQLLGSLKREKGQRRIAEIMNVDSDPSKHIVTINKGSLDNVYIGQPILDATGVLGQVISTSTLTSKALLITDSSHAIPVKILRNGIRAIAKGTGNPNQLILEQLPHTTDIKLGDTLVTSGLGMRFPSGFPVATIKIVNNDPGQAFAQALATTSADLLRTGLVVLLWPDHRLEVQ